MKPNLEVLIDLAKGEDSAMWGNETIDYRKDDPFPYQYNKSLQHTN